ncbi:MAG: hypothetical protein KDA22_03520, partial [Phycisphaerales bacterium]|nr:hypothetical protein [Phycisphaerales bacterium]
MDGRHTSRRGMLRVRFAPLFALAQALLILALGRSAAAQGTSGQFPDPVSSRDLLVILDRYVKPDPEQWTAIERFHDTYKAEFAALREGDIDKFLQDARSMQGRMPSTKQMEDYIHRMDRINDRIRTLDNRLIDQIQTVLRDDQITQVPRVRLARERQVYTGSMMSRALAGGGRTSDLSQIVSTLELSPEEAAAIDRECATYETQLTRAAGKLRDATMRMFADLIAALEAAGFGDMGPEDMANDPDRMQRMMEVIKEAYAAVGRRTAERAADIVEINRRTLRAFSTQLPPDQARKLRGTFLAESYPQIQQLDPSVELALRAAIRSTTLPDDQRAAAEAMLRSFFATDDSIVDKMMDLADRTRAGATPFDFDPAAMEAQQKSMQELVDERNKAMEGFRAQAEALLGREILERLMADAAASDGNGVGSGDIAPVDREPDSAQAPEPPRPRGPVPPSIGVAEIGDWTRRLAPPAERKAILDTAHGDYLDRWQKEVAPFAQKIADAQRRIYGWGESGENFSPDESSVDEVYELRRQAIDAANRMDAELMAIVREFVATEAQDRDVRLIELRRLLRVGRPEDSMSWIGFGRTESNEASLDLFEIVDQALHGNDNGVAELIILDHADRLAETTRQLADATRDAQRLQERLSSVFFLSSMGGWFPISP